MAGSRIQPAVKLTRLSLDIMLARMADATEQIADCLEVLRQRLQELKDAKMSWHQLWLRASSIRPGSRQKFNAKDTTVNLRFTPRWNDDRAFAGSPRTIQRRT